MKLRRVTPSGSHVSRCFVEYADGHGEFKDCEIKDYPHQERRDALRVRRAHVAGMSLREASKRLGISVVDYSAIELGSLEPEEWSELIEILFGGPS